MLLGTLTLFGVLAGAVARANDTAAASTSARASEAGESAGPLSGPLPGAVIFVAADMRGYLAPCGCSENMRGGLMRAAHLVAQARRQGGPVFYLDAGDALFGKTRLSAEEVPQEERKAHAIAAAFKQMGLVARASGEKDDARGAAFRKKLGLPEVAPGSVQRFEADGQTIAVIAGGDAASLATGSRKARAKGSPFVIALFHGTFEQAQKAANDPSVDADLIVASHAPDEFSGESSRLMRARIPVAQVQSKGRSLMRVDVWFGPGEGRFELMSTEADTARELASLDERIALLNKQINVPNLPAQAKTLRQQKLEELMDRREALAAQKTPAPEGGRDAFAVRFVPLEATVPSDPAVESILAAYDRDVGKLNLAWAKQHGRDCPKPAAGKAGFVGSASCRDCHEEAFPVWEKSKHAHAYETLVEKGKQFHLNCVGCHVTGFQQPGGVCRVDRVEGREGVGCESCHGPGSLHVADPTDTNITLGNTEAGCVTCHDQENSPHFDFRTWLPEVLGPGHGRKK